MMKYYLMVKSVSNIIKYSILMGSYSDTTVKYVVSILCIMTLLYLSFHLLNDVLFYKDLQYDQ